MSALGEDVAARQADTLRRTLDATGPLLERVFSPRASGVEQLRRPGPALLVGNHSGGLLAVLEPLVLAHAVRAELGDDAMPHVLVHEALWHTPLAPTLAELGAVRASAQNAHALLAAGRRVLVYPGGDCEAFRPFADRDRVTLGDRRGYVRLALEAGVPIVPVVTAGMHSSFVSLTDGHALAQCFGPAMSLRVGVLPVTVSLPFGLSVGMPAPYLPLNARVRIRALPAIHFSRSGPEAAADGGFVDACHGVVVGQMQSALDRLAAERRVERRRALHARLDDAVDVLERLTGVRAAGPLAAVVPIRAIRDERARRAA